MRASDVVKRLAAYLPGKTDLFSDTFIADDAQPFGNAMILRGDGIHNIAPVGAPIYVDGVRRSDNIPTLNRTNNVGILTTNIQHDFTEGYSETVTIADAQDPVFDGTWDIISVPDRNTVTFDMPPGPDIALGGFAGNIIDSVNYFASGNGLFKVSLSDNDAIFYMIDGGFPTLGAVRNEPVTVKHNIRISGAASLSRAIAAYTAQDTDKAFMFAVLGDTQASKTRFTQSDNTTRHGTKEYYRQRILETVFLYVIANPTDTIAARKMRDDMVDMLKHIGNSIIGHQFETNLHINQSVPLGFVSHGIVDYDGALYIHEFSFETETEILFEDTVGDSPSVAFRDIEMDILPDFGTFENGAEAIINLDGESE